MTVGAEPIAGRYELVEEIDSGGMGRVWRGYDAVLDREVAIKLIRPEAVHSPEEAREFAKRFQREARVTARIQHHGVPQVYDAVLDRPYDRVYLVMEYVRGTPLRAFINPERPLPIAWAAAIAAQICTVLSHAHAVPVVHRDIKPENVLVTDAGMVKLLDFGVAAMHNGDVTRLTRPNQVVGSRYYMAPEQVTCARVTPRTDLYALGCLLHELLTGRVVFRGTEYQLMYQHCHRPPTPVRELRPDVPEELERLVLDLLAKAPEERPADAYEVYERLLPFLPPPGAAPPPVGRELAGMPDPTLLYRRPNPPRRRTEAPPLVPAAPARPAAPGGAAPAVPHPGLRDAIRAALAQFDALLEQERYTQAAEVLGAVVGPASEALGPEHPRVLALRARRAGSLFLGGDVRRALPEFDALVAAYRRSGNAAHPDAVDCLRQAADCRAELGQATAALRQYREALGYVRAESGDVSPTALDLRRNIGVVLAGEGRTGEAVAELQPLYDDLCLVYGPEHDEAREVAGMLARLRLTDRS
jgi:Serine/threonine protein kinase